MTADKIAANAITAVKIAANAVTADKVAANSITASKLVLSPGNLIKDANFDDRACWTAGLVQNDANAQAVVVAAPTAFNRPGENALRVRMTRDAVASTSTYGWGITSAPENTLAERGRYVRVSCDVIVNSDFAGTVGVHVEVLDAADKGLGTNGGGVGISYTDVDIKGKGLMTLSAVATKPLAANAAKIRCYLRLGATTNGGQCKGTVYFCAPCMNYMADAEMIVDGAITAVKIAANAVTATKIQANSIGTNHIQANAVNAGKIAANTIQTGHIQAGAIKTAQIAAGQVNADKLAANAVVAGKIAANAVTATQLAAGSVTAQKVIAGAINGNHIAANTISATHIVSKGITADKLNVSTLSAVSANMGSITAGSMKIGALSGNTGTLFEVASNGGFRLVSRDSSGGIELSSSTRALTVWNGNTQVVKVGKL
ncbi:hypothetical protein A1D23_13430 [Chelonobacter oris]|nr:hypothetical protein [Chelonobacter oris]